jgi:hypothetical protein
MTLLVDGRPLIVSGHASDEAELFDPVTRAWIPAGRLVTPRYNHAAVALRDGTVLVVGGDHGADKGVTAAELYDPREGSWSPTGELQVVPHSHSALALADGTVLVAGAGRGTGTSVEAYHPGARTWSRIPQAPAWASTDGALLADGRALMVDSEVVGLFDAASGTWAMGSPMNQPRDDGTMTPLANGQVLMAGGYRLRPIADGMESFPISSAELYEPDPPTR